MPTDFVHGWPTISMCVTDKYLQLAFITRCRRRDLRRRGRIGSSRTASLHTVREVIKDSDRGIMSTLVGVHNDSQSIQR